MLRKEVKNYLLQTFNKAESTKIEKMVFEWCENFDLDYEEVAYDKCGELVDLEKKKIPFFLQAGDVGYSSTYYHKFREKEKLEIDEETKPIKLQKSDEKCRKCKAHNCAFYLLQTRGGDEGMTSFWSCLSCGHRWTKN